MKLKHFFLFALFTLLTLSVISCAASPIEEADEYFVYTLLDDDTYSIRARDITHLPEELVIPDTYNGKQITQISEDGFIHATIYSVVIGNNITSIKSGAFSRCAELQYVYVPNNVTGFGKAAFAYCPNLLEIEYSGTEHEWNNILKAGNWNIQFAKDPSKTITVYCSDETIEIEVKN